MEPTQSSLIGNVIGKFRIVRMLGEGGMGSVFLAERTEDFDQQVALKLILDGLHDDAILARFELERQALASLQHPNIVRIVDSGVSSTGLPYLAMEYVDGLPIDRWCDQHRVSVSDRLKLFLQVLDAVEYAHQRFLLHCDLKPSNIFVASDGHVRLLDFGVAKLLNPESFGFGEGLTQATLRPFTPDFASPEQLKSGVLTTATDVYSAGAVLHALLCGQAPFEELRDDPVKRIRAVCAQDPEPLSRRASTLALSNPPDAQRIAEGRSTSPEALVSTLRGDLDAIVSKALRPQPEQRYPNASAFAADLNDTLACRPVAARPPSVGYRLSRFAARNRVAVASGALLTVVLALFLGAWLSQFWRAQQSRARATARFADVRRITNSLLFDFYDTVAQLPGATPAQENLVRWSLRYLDDLAARNASDGTLQLELAEGYRKLGDLLGNPYMNNLGKPAEAVDAFAKGLALLHAPTKSPGPTYFQAEFLRTQPRDGLLAMARIYRSQSQIRWLAGESDLCIEDADRSLQLFVHLAQSYPKDYEVQMETAAKLESHADLYAGAYWVVADVARARSLLEDAESYARRAIAADPSQVRPYRALSIFRMKLADLLADSDPAASIPLFDEAMRLIEAVPEAGRMEAATQRVRRVIVFRAAWSQSATGNHTKAVEMYHSVLAEHEEAVRLDPTNEQAHWDLAVLLKQSGEARLYGEDFEGALADYSRCVSVIDSYYQGELDGERRAALGEVLVYQGVALGRLGRTQEAALATRRGLSILETEVAKPEQSASLLQRAARSYLLALPRELRKPRAALALLDRNRDESKDENSLRLALRAEAAAELGDPANAAALARKAMTLTSEKENLNEWKRLQRLAALH
jgi:non-specific serine/threonine protein kinase/serine/threonine-protein kinase